MKPVSAGAHVPGMLRCHFTWSYVPAAQRARKFSAVRGSLAKHLDLASVALTYLDIAERRVQCDAHAGRTSWRPRTTARRAVGWAENRLGPPPRFFPFSRPSMPTDARDVLRAAAILTGDRDYELLIEKPLRGPETVSYTHLTLPTICSV